MKKFLFLVLFCAARFSPAQIISTAQIVKFQLQPQPAGNPPFNSAFVYVDQSTGKLRCINASGGSCDPTGGGAPSGPAGGDLSGTYPDPSVTATHLSVPLPRAQGGLNSASAGTGILRDGATPAASELSGDCATSGSNAVVCTKTNGVAFAASATTDTTNAANIASGTLPAGRLPNPSATTLGGIESLAAVTHQFLTSISTSGVPAQAQPAAADVSGLAASATTDTTNAANIVSGVLAKTQGGTAVDNSSVTFPSSGVIPVVPISSGITTSGGLLSAQGGTTDSVACPNNTTANFASTYTIPASYLTAHRILRVSLSWGATTSASPPNTSIRLQIGGTNVFVGAASAPTANLAGGTYSQIFLIQGTAAASASAGVITSPQNTATAPFTTNASSIAQPVNLATNGTLVIQPVLFCSANTAGNTWVLQQMMVESLN